jgi:SAM-dependent methyltransferase
MTSASVKATPTTTAPLGVVDVRHGDCRDILRTLPDASIDAIVTDPPYELGFMGKGWDAAGIAYDVAMWAECLRVLKPGGHLLAFGGSRTWHRLVVAIEDAGFEVRDSITWLYASGFPKSLDVSKAIDKAAGAAREVVGKRWEVNRKPGVKAAGILGEYGPDDGLLTAPATPAAQQWQGWGTALKPAHEPICVARKPLAGTVAATVLAHGTGALNIDATRVPSESGRPLHVSNRTAGNQVYGEGLQGPLAVAGGTDLGRWPSNVVLTHVGTALYTLRHDAPEAIRAYYSADEAVRTVRVADRGDAFGSSEAPVLREGVREPVAAGSSDGAASGDDLRDLLDVVRGAARMGEEWTPEVLLGRVPLEGAEAGPDGPPTHSGGPSEDGQQPAHTGTVVAVEGRPVRDQGIHVRPDRPAPGGDAQPGAADDEGAVHRGAPGRGRSDGRQAAAGERRGAPHERREVGQSAGEPDRSGSSGPLDGAPRVREALPGDAGRGGATEDGERRLAVPPDLIPAGWLRYFDGVVEAPDCGPDDAPGECVEGCPVVELDAQSGITKAGTPRPERGKGGIWADGDGVPCGPQYGDSGGASRFFPTFRYQAKAPTRERPKVDGAAHPTVKPLALMRWLVRLVTPPGGTVLDPFLGSGTTAEAAALEGFDVIGCELTADYLPLIAARLARIAPPAAPPTTVPTMADAIAAELDAATPHRDPFGTPALFDIPATEATA